MTPLDDLKILLSKHILSVSFVKKDGTTRKMFCTLRKDIVKPYIKKTEKVKTTNEDILCVWDTEKEAFRSIKLDSLVDYSVLEEEHEL